MKSSFCVLLLLCRVGTLPGAELAPVPVAAPTEPAVDQPAKRTVQHEGEIFELASSNAAANVQTDEYVLAGEKLADWSQLVTVQRLSLAQKSGADEFLSYFEKRVADDGASLEALKRTKNACVFVVRFPKTERNEEQVMICLGFLEPANPSRLNIVQYALKPHRVPLATIEARIRSWRDKFLRQASVGE